MLFRSIERRKRGQGNPDIIYVKNFTSIQEEDENEDVNIEEVGHVESADPVQKLNNLNSKNVKTEETCGVQNEESLNSRILNSKTLNSEDLTSKNLVPRDKESEVQEIANFSANNTKYNNIEFNNPNLINLSVTDSSEQPEAKKMDEMDEATAYMELIKENLEYDIMMSNKNWSDGDMFDELYELICDVVCVPRKTIRIAGEDYPYALVKSKFLKLNAQHLEYVMTCMQNNITKVGNIKAYLITALYNAPNTIGHYYNAEVRHDLYGTI